MKYWEKFRFWLIRLVIGDWSVLANTDVQGRAIISGDKFVAFGNTFHPPEDE